MKKNGGCFDYSQQEPRLVVHFALRTTGIIGIDTMAKAFREDPSTDFHQIVADIAGIDRKEAKTINLGLFYGMGVAKLQNQLGINDEEEAKELINKYHRKVPFVKQLMKETMNRAQTVGRIRTIGGRLCRFDKWEPKDWDIKKWYDTRQEAADENGENNIKRAFTYKALNRLIQGSAADMTKKAMVNLYKEGILPMVQVHDELNVSIVDDQQANKVKEIMENAVILEIPNKVDYESGENWGSIDKKEEEDIDKNFF